VTLKLFIRTDPIGKTIKMSMRITATNVTVARPGLRKKCQVSLARSWIKLFCREILIPASNQKVNLPQRDVPLSLTLFSQSESGDCISASKPGVERGTRYRREVNNYFKTGERRGPCFSGPHFAKH
jgi:hypothetical protein